MHCGFTHMSGVFRVAFLFPELSQHSVVKLLSSEVTGFAREKAEAARVLKGKDQRWHHFCYVAPMQIITTAALTQEEA